jgi:hypothetical protein
MPTTPSAFINSPSSGTRYNASDGYWVIPNGSTTVSVQVTCWSGANGTGSHVTVSSLTAYVVDASTATDKNSFTGGSAFSASANYSLPNGSDSYAGGVLYSGGAVGSIEIVVTYTGSPVIGTISGISPTVGGPGTTVTISGSFIDATTAVSFNGTPAASFIDVNFSTVTAVVPAGATAGPITLTFPQGSANSATFTPSSFYVDDGGTWQACTVYVDDGSNWQLATVYVSDGSAWQQIA